MRSPLSLVCGEQRGPCGPFSGKENWGRGPVATLKPGLQTLTWEESISHAGAPFRIAILDENEEAKVVLLNHIPHWVSAFGDLEDTLVRHILHSPGQTPNTQPLSTPLKR
jgi:hypothetical protein